MAALNGVFVFLFVPGLNRKRWSVTQHKTPKAQFCSTGNSWSKGFPLCAGKQVGLFRLHSIKVLMCSQNMQGRHCNVVMTVCGPSRCRCGDHVLLSGGPLVSRTGLCSQYEVTALHSLGRGTWGLQRRAQGLSLPLQLQVQQQKLERICKQSIHSFSVRGRG